MGTKWTRMGTKWGGTSTPKWDKNAKKVETRTPKWTRMGTKWEQSAKWVQKP